MTMSAEWARRLTDDDEWIVRTALSSIASDLEKVADEAKRANPGGPIDRVEGRHPRERSALPRSARPDRAGRCRGDPPCLSPRSRRADRFFTHYDMQWGTVERLNYTDRDRTHGVTGSPLPDTSWYDVRYDNGRTSTLDDAHGDWEMARMVPPQIAERYGYGRDPKAV
jgi:hypothetical protein